MGEAKESIKGSGPPAARRQGTALAGAGNLLQMIQSASEEVSRLTAIKDEDAMTEGDAAKPENVRKAATLRAAHALLKSVGVLLEDY